MTYATRTKAVKAIAAKGFVFVEPTTMDAAAWRKGGAYAWISENWSPKHQAYRFQVHMAGAA